MTNEEKMRVAIEVAGESLKNGELPVGAVIFRGDEIVAKACSSGEDSAKYLRHAEMKALWEADSMGYSYSERCEMQLFVTMEPCMMCLGAAASFYIGEIFYAHESPIDGAVKFAKEYWRPDNKEILTYKLPKCYGGLLREESRELLRQYVVMKKEGSLVDFCNTLLSL